MKTRTVRFVWLFFLWSAFSLASAANSNFLMLNGKRYTLTHSSNENGYVYHQYDATHDSPIQHLGFDGEIPFVQVVQGDTTFDPKELESQLQELYQVPFSTSAYPIRPGMTIFETRTKPSNTHFSTISRGTITVEMSRPAPAPFIHIQLPIITDNDQALNDTFSTLHERLSLLSFAENHSAVQVADSTIFIPLKEAIAAPATQKQKPEPSFSYWSFVKWPRVLLIGTAAAGAVSAAYFVCKGHRDRWAAMLTLAGSVVAAFYYF